VTYVVGPGWRMQFQVDATSVLEGGSLALGSDPSQTLLQILARMSPSMCWVQPSLPSSAVPKAHSCLSVLLFGSSWIPSASV
jgi:hypothetical protein